MTLKKKNNRVGDGKKRNQIYPVFIKSSTGWLDAASILYLTISLGHELTVLIIKWSERQRRDRDEFTKGLPTATWIAHAKLFFQSGCGATAFDATM